MQAHAGQESKVQEQKANFALCSHFSHHQGERSKSGPQRLGFFLFCFVLQRTQACQHCIMYCMLCIK